MQRSFYPVPDFPQLAELSSNWELIREEFLNLNVDVLPIDRVDKDYSIVYDEVIQHMNNGGEYGWLIGWGGKQGANIDWLQFGLIAKYQVVEWAVKYMPKTIELLKSIPAIKVCGLAKMKPHCYLATHSHPEIQAENLLQYHLTIDVPENSNYNYLNVAGEFNQNQLGEPVIFDGSLEHFALNASTQDRTILYLEFQKEALFP